MMFKDQFLIGMIVGAIIAVLVWQTTVVGGFKDEAVERGFAQHNSITGEWEWKQ